MMEIPAGLDCDGGPDHDECPFHSDDCMCVYSGEEFHGDGVLVYERLPECRAAYPYGGTVTITAKEREQDNTTEEEYGDMRRNGGPEVKP